MWFGSRDEVVDGGPFSEHPGVFRTPKPTKEHEGQQIGFWTLSGGVNDGAVIFRDSLFHGDLIANLVLTE